MNRILTVVILISIAILSAAQTSFAQTKAKKPAKKTPAKKVQSVAAAPVEPMETKTPEKKNERPGAASADYENSAKQQEPQKKNQSPKAKTNAVAQAESKNVFAYEFSQPDFVVNHILIQHDETGKGTITFEKKMFGDPVTDPIQLSSAALERIKNLFQTLNFLDSTEEYQSPIRQYAHLGTMKIRLKMDGRERAAEFNWTENKEAKALADEYRKIGEQYIWIFDITLARENQPLEAPKLMDKLDIMVKRNDISDPAQMIPLLKKLSDDERIPLIARNHATRIVKEIENKDKK